MIPLLFVVHSANRQEALGHDKAQNIIDQITAAYETSGGPPPGGFGFGPQHLAPPPPFGGPPPMGFGGPPGAFPRERYTAAWPHMSNNRGHTARPPFPPGPGGMPPPGMLPPGAPPFLPGGMPPPGMGLPGAPPFPPTGFPGTNFLITFLP